MKTYVNRLLILAAAVLVALPLAIYKKKDSGEIFTGADGHAKDMVKTIAPDYKPWIESPLKPPSGEVESLLFALQAAVGAGFIGYYFGVRRERLRMGAKRKVDGL